MTNKRFSIITVTWNNADGLQRTLKSVVEPLAKEKVSIGCITEVLAVCEGGGLSKQRWRDTPP